MASTTIFPRLFMMWLIGIFFTSLSKVDFEIFFILKKIVLLLPELHDLWLADPNILEIFFFWFSFLIDWLCWFFGKGWLLRNEDHLITIVLQYIFIVSRGLDGLGGWGYASAPAVGSGFWLDFLCAFSSYWRGSVSFWGLLAFGLYYPHESIDFPVLLYSFLNVLS